MEKFEALEKAMCKELEAIQQKLVGGAEMSETELRRVDMLTHAMKSLATYEAMKDAEDWEGEMSGRRGRAMNGQYVSRTGNSYADGYSQGYSEAMAQSGRFSIPYRYRY